MAVGILLLLVIFAFSSGRLPVSPAANADAQGLVSLYVDGQKRVFTTQDKTVAEVLAHSGVVLEEGDRVEPMATTKVAPGFFNINVYRARPILVQDGYRSYHIASAYQSPRLLAQAAGVNVYPEDAYDMAVITDVVGEAAIGVKVSVKRAVPLTLHIDGKVRPVRTQGKTVKEMLDKAKVALGPADTVSVKLDTPITLGMQVVVVRVSDVERTITDKLPRPVQKVNDPNLPKGQMTVRTEGADGARTGLYRVHYRDGLENGRKLLKLVSETKPITRVELVGTKIFFAGSVEYWRPQVIAAAAPWGLNPNAVLQIMACESHGNATVVSRFVVNGEHPMGLFQYLPTTWRAAGGTDANILDGSVQIKLTAKKMALYGISPWACKPSVPLFL